MKTIVSLINAGIRSLIAELCGSETTVLVSYAKNACAPKLKTYKVSYFDKTTHKWTSQLVKAYTASDAASQLGLRAGYNCFVGYQVRG